MKTIHLVAFSFFLNLICLNVNANNPCFDLGHPENRWHFVELPNELNDVKWQSSGHGISAVSFNSTEENINNWLKKCSIKLENDGSLKSWYMVDVADARALTVFRSKITGRVCIQIEESQAPGSPENPKGFGDCISDFEGKKSKP